MHDVQKLRNIILFRMQLTHLMFNKYYWLAHTKRHYEQHCKCQIICLCHIFSFSVEFITVLWFLGSHKLCQLSSIQSWWQMDRISWWRWTDQGWYFINHVRLWLVIYVYFLAVNLTYISVDLSYSSIWLYFFLLLHIDFCITIPLHSCFNSTPKF